MSLLEHFENIPDFRRRAGRRYSLPSFLMMIILGTMSGHYGYRELNSFMKGNAEELGALFSLKNNKVPSHVSIRTFMRGLDYQALIAVFNAWMSEHSLLEEGEAISFDGKCLGSTVKDARSSKQDFVQLVSAFSHHREQVLCVESFQQTKGHEANVVRNLIEKLDLQGALFTLDALHCQKKTLDLINSQGNEYVVQVKANCSKLYASCQKTVAEQEPINTDLSREQQKGRVEIREVKVFEWVEPVSKNWQNASITHLIYVRRVSKRDGKWIETEHFYISNSKKASAFFFSKVIRGHWGIENKLHWVKDVIQKEDESPIDHKTAARNISVCKSIAINIFKQNKHFSIKNAIIKFGNKINELYKMIK